MSRVTTVITSTIPISTTLYAAAVPNEKSRSCAKISIEIGRLACVYSTTLATKSPTAVIAERPADVLLDTSQLCADRAWIVKGYPSDEPQSFYGYLESRWFTAVNFEPPPLLCVAINTGHRRTTSGWNFVPKRVLTG